MELKEYNPLNVETDDDCLVLVTSDNCTSCTTAKAVLESIEDCEATVHVANARDVMDVIRRTDIASTPALVYVKYGAGKYESTVKFGKKEVVKFLNLTIGYTRAEPVETKTEDDVKPKAAEAPKRQRK